MPPIRSGSTVRVASTFRPEACSICCSSLPASSSESSTAVVSCAWTMPSASATRRANSAAISSSWPARPLSARTSRKLRSRSSVPSRTSSSAARRARGSSCGFLRSPRSSGTSRSASTSCASCSPTGSSFCWSRAASNSAFAYTRSTTLMRATPDGQRFDWSVQTVARAGLVRPDIDIASDVSLAALQHGEVELADGLLDQALVVGVVERLARHLGRREQAEVDDLEADLLERTTRLGLDLLARLLEPTLAVFLELLAHAALVGLCDAACLAEDLVGVATRARDQLAVLLEEPARLLAGVVGLLQRLPDPLAPLVDHLLHGPEREALEHEQRDQEADDRPDHQPRGDLDQGVGCERHRHG